MKTHKLYLYAAKTEIYIIENKLFTIICVVGSQMA